MSLSIEQEQDTFKEGSAGMPAKLSVAKNNLTIQLYILPLGWRQS